MKNTIVIKQRIQPAVEIKEIELTLPAFFKGYNDMVYLGIYSDIRMVSVQVWTLAESIELRQPNITTEYTPCTEEEFAAAYYKASAALSKAYDTALGVELPESLKTAA